MFAFLIQLHEDPAAYGFRSPVRESQFLGTDYRCDDRRFPTAAGRVFAKEFYRVLGFWPCHRQGGLTTLWDVLTHRHLITARDNLGSVHGLGFSPDGKRP